jgi:hypothetical protein
MNKIIKFTEEQINKMSDNELKRVIIAYSDGQGDTYLINLYDEFNFDPGYNKPCDYINGLFGDYGGNMVKLGWIENNQLLKLNIIY